MADAGRYRLIYSRLQLHPSHRALSERERYVTYTLLTSRQLNRAGLAYFSVSMAAEDALVPLREYQRAFRAVLDAHGWAFDTEAGGVLYIPSWLKFNPPQNPSHLASILSDLGEIHHCALLNRFAVEAVQHLRTDAQRELFVSAMRTRGLPREAPPTDPRGTTGVETRVQTRPGHQELELELEQEQEQELTDDTSATRREGTAVHQFLKTFCDRYTEVLGAKYHVIASRDVPAVKRLLREYGPETLEEMANTLLHSNDPWIASTDRGIGILSTKASWLHLGLQTSPKDKEPEPDPDWLALIEGLETQLSRHRRHELLQLLRFAGRTGDQILLECDDQDKRDYILRNYNDPLQEAARRVGVACLEVRVSPATETVQ